MNGHPPKRRTRWRVLGCVAVVLLAGYFAAVFCARRAAVRYLRDATGLEPEIESLWINPIAPSVTVRRLLLRDPRATGEWPPVTRIEDIRAAAPWGGLLRGTPQCAVSIRSVNVCVLQGASDRREEERTGAATRPERQQRRDRPRGEREVDVSLRIESFKVSVFNARDPDRLRDVWLSGRITADAHLGGAADVRGSFESTVGVVAGPESPGYVRTLFPFLDTGNFEYARVFGAFSCTDGASRHDVTFDGDAVDVVVGGATGADGRMDYTASLDFFETLGLDDRAAYPEDIARIELLKFTGLMDDGGKLVESKFDFNSEELLQGALASVFAGAMRLKFVREALGPEELQEAAAFLDRLIRSGDPPNPSNAPGEDQSEGHDDGR